MLGCCGLNQKASASASAEAEWPLFGLIVDRCKNSHSIAFEITLKEFVRKNNQSLPAFNLRLLCAFINKTTLIHGIAYLAMPPEKVSNTITEQI
jgi:hypothetical protein